MNKKIILLVLISSLFGAHALEGSAAPAAPATETDAVTRSVNTGWQIAGSALKWGLAAQGVWTMAAFCEQLVAAHPVIAGVSALATTLAGVLARKKFETYKERVGSLALATAATVGAISTVGPLWLPRPYFVCATGAAALYCLANACKPVEKTIKAAKARISAGICAFWKKLTAKK